MRFTSTINNVRLVEWEINITQGALVDLINQASSWAKPVVIDGVTYYWMSFSKVCEELPAVFSKEDTVYRQYKVLKEKGIIEHFKMDGKDYVRLTEKGCEWNKFEPIRMSEKNPSVGHSSIETRKKIRENSEKNPTDNNTKINIQDHNIPLNPPLGETQGDSVAVLNYLNDRLAELSKAVEQPLPKFQAVPNTLKNIKARLGESSRVECETVVDYLVAKWGRDGKMREYLSPKTIFRASNFADYLPESTAWAANGKPVCVNGKWVSVAELLRVENTPTVDEVRNGYLKYLSLGRGYFKTWQFATAREKALYWAIITVKNKRPLERDTLFACKQSIEEVMAKIDTLKIPQMGENQ